MNYNQLTGDIPPELGNLTSLRELYLSNNQLSGAIPPELGNLTVRVLDLSNNQLKGEIPEGLVGYKTQFHLEVLRLSANPLSGALPRGLMYLYALESFYYDDTDLCEPSQDDFQAWLAGIPDLKGTGVRCPQACDGVSGLPRAECDALVSLYSSTNGPSWTHRDDWLTTGEPCGWYGVTCEAGHVHELRLASNQLSGTIPPEVGDLASLRYLELASNQLSGTIPPELGDLASLWYLAQTLQLQRVERWRHPANRATWPTWNGST